MERIRHSEKVIGILWDSNGRDSGNNKEARNDTQLTPNHESRKVVSGLVIQKCARLLGPVSISALGFVLLGSVEERNLHTFKHTNHTQQDHEKNDRQPTWNTFPHGSLALEQGFKDHSHAKSEDGSRDQGSEVEEGGLGGRLWWFVGFDWLSGHGTDGVLDNVREMHQTRELDSHGKTQGEVGKVVVTVVKHTNGSVHLRVQLTNHTCEENHGETGDKEDINNNLWHAPESSVSDWSSAQVDGENNEDDHELTSHQVTVEVVSGVAEQGVLVSNWVRLLVQFAVNWGKTDERSLGSFDHRQPNDGNPHHNEGNSWVNILGKSGLSGEDQTSNDNTGEDQQNSRVDILDVCARVGAGARFVGHGCYCSVVLIV